MIAQLFEISKLVKALCAKTGDQSIGSRVKSGKIQLVSVQFQGRRTVEVEMSEWMPVAEFIEFLKDKAA